MARRARKSTRDTDDGNSGVEGNGGGPANETGGTAGDSTVDPSAIGGDATADDSGTDSAAGGTGRRRGRPRGARTRTKGATLDLGDFKDILLTAHAGLASMFHAETLLITDDEADRISKAIANVMRHYDVPQMAAETKDWISLILALGSVYGPRIAAAWVAGKAPAPRPSPPGTVVQFNSPGPVPPQT